MIFCTGKYIKFTVPSRKCRLSRNWKWGNLLWRGGFTENSQMKITLNCTFWCVYDYTKSVFKQIWIIFGLILLLKKEYPIPFSFLLFIKLFETLILLFWLLKIKVIYNQNSKTSNWNIRVYKFTTDNKNYAHAKIHNYLSMQKLSRCDKKKIRKVSYRLFLLQIFPFQSILNSFMFSK